MDAGRFDDLARALGAPRTRRAGLKAALGALAGLVAWPVAAMGSRAASDCDVCGSGCRFTTIGTALANGLAHVRVAPGVYREHSLAMRNADRDGKASITRCGDSGAVIIDAEGKGRVLRVERVPVPLLEDLVIRNGDASRSEVGQFGGGVLFRDGKPKATLRRVAVTGCTALGGGGISGEFDALVMEDCDLSGNAGLGGGGGVFVSSARALAVRDVVIRDNDGTGGGGGMWVASLKESAVFESVTFWKNRSLANGGGLFLQGSGKVTLRRVTLWDNHSASEDGGGAALWGGEHTLEDVTIRDNSAGSYGGGLSVVNAGAARLTKVTITGNTAGEQGGGTSLEARVTSLRDVSVTGNRTSGKGGGIYVEGTLELDGDVAVWGNTAGIGGGLATSTTLTCVNGKPKSNAICGNAPTNCAGTASSGDCACDAAPCRAGACGKDQPCPTGFTCEKRGGEKRCECASGVICGTACCAAGKVCQGGACATPTPPCSEKGQRCGQDSGLSCCAGLTCSGQVGVEPVCLVEAGGACQTSADCTYGTTCTGGRCVQPPPPTPCTPTVRPGDDAGLKRALEAGGAVTLGAGSWTLTVRTGGGGGSRTLDRPGAVVTGAATLAACPGTRPAVRCTVSTGNDTGACIEVRDGGSLGLRGIALGGVAGSAPRNGIVLDYGSRLAMSASTVTGFGIGINNGNDDSQPIACSAASGNSVCGNADSNCQTLAQPDLFPNCGCCPPPP